MSNAVPFVDLSAQYRQDEKAIDDAVRRILARGDFILGEDVERFEEEFAQYCEVQHAVGVANGTDALVLALQALGIGHGQMVLTTPLTYVSTADAVSRLGARVEFVDIHPASFNMDPARLEDFFKARIKETAGGVIDRTTGLRVGAILPVHLYGQPADMDLICGLAQRYQIPVVEDCAQAHGARYKGRRVGTFGIISAFSFYPSKNLGACGDGGAIVTDDPQLAASVRSLRIQGRRGKYEHMAIGLNSRLDTLHAAVLRIKLRRLDSWNEARRQAARRYDVLLGGIKGIQVPSWILGNEPVYHLYVLRAKEREGLQQALAAKGIGTGIHYPIPVHRQPAYQHLGFSEGAFPVAEQSAREVLSLPMFPEIQDGQQRQVADAIASWAKDRPYPN